MTLVEEFNALLVKVGLKFILLLFRLLMAATHEKWHTEVPRLGVESNLCCCQPTPQPQPHQIQVVPSTYTIAHNSAGSLTHWVRPGIKPSSSWILVRFVSIAPQWELPSFLLLMLLFSSHFSPLKPVCSLSNTKLIIFMITS